MKKVFVVDGNSILNRAFYGVRPLSTKDGFPTNALYGTVNMITKQAERLKPDYSVVAFDLKAPTFRHKMYDGYKAGRKPMPEDLAKQMPECKDLLTAMGYHILTLEGYEADDILGTLSKMAEDAGDECYLMTGDRDSLQLISEKTTVLLATNAETIDMTPSAFRAQYGYEASQFVDAKAIMGDSSDNIPGIPGIGEKGAQKIIQTYGSIDALYEQFDPKNFKPAEGRKIAEGKESAYLSRTLATICRDAPLGVSLDDLETREWDKETLASKLVKFELFTFLKRWGLDTVTVKSQKTEILDDGCKRYAVGLNDGVWQIYDGENTRDVQDLEKELSSLTDAPIVVYDLKNLYHQGFPEQGNTQQMFDCMLGAYLLESDRSGYELSQLTEEYLGKISAEPLKEIWELYPILSKRLEESGQDGVMKDIEMPLCRVLFQMERDGFRVDRKEIQRYGEMLELAGKETEERIYFQAGHEFNIRSPQQLGVVLFDELGIPYTGKKTAKGYSTAAEILEKVKAYHTIVEDVLEYRQYAKLKSTYVDGLLKVADEDGTVHTTFKQTGTATGRLSSAEPNLQNIPVRTELGREMRKFFLPRKENYVIIDADYSQIELRVLANLSGDKNMIDAFLSGEDIHTSTASAVFNVPVDMVSKDLRKQAKAINFGILYGMGAYSLSEDLNISVKSAKDYIDRYLERFSGVDHYQKNTIQKAYDTGYTETMFGRRRYISELSGSNKMLQKAGERIAMNSPIQGTSADIIKIAMIRVQNRLEAEHLDAKLILQVHDELLLEANQKDAEKAATILREEMEHVANFRVPLLVEVGTGKNWDEAKV